MSFVIRSIGLIDVSIFCGEKKKKKVYSSCQESYRLNAEGTLNVPKEATDDYCGGPCLSETKLVLSCVDEILYNFKFYNGASVQDVKYTLDAGCGDTNKRGILYMMWIRELDCEGMKLTSDICC